MVVAQALQVIAKVVARVFWMSMGITIIVAVAKAFWVVLTVEAKA